MALKKKIAQSNGIETSYHRILYLQITPNQGCSIAVQSYIDESARLEEQSGENESVYKSAVTYETDYDETMTIEKAYKHLKKLEKFSGAEDV